MNDLVTRLDRLGLDQYLDAFVGEGFDTWETLLDIQESDLESLNVKLGHRRKLQRAIAEYRGISYERLIGSPAGEGPSDSTRQTDPSQAQTTSKEGTTAPPTEAKRKYRRHPKPDENAPEKSPSAYVLFSNKVREEVKGENLSFTEIAKLVGDRWQKLETGHKEPFESHANALKEAYNIRLAAYKKTDSYRDYCQYLEDFKVKHGQNAESKRPKLGAQSSTGSASIASAASQEVVELVPSHRRVGSMESVSTTTCTGNMQSPSNVGLNPVTSLPNLTTSVSWPASLVSATGSPAPAQLGMDRRLMPTLSTQSSVSDESGPSRSETYDPLPRAATLSLSTPPTGTPPLPGHVPNSTRSEHGVSSESYTWATRLSQNTSQYPVVAPGPHSTITLPSPILSGEPWRERGDLHRPPPNPGFMQPGSFTGTLPTPTIMGSERMPDLMRSSAQRTLPPLRQPTGIPSHFGHQGGLPTSAIFNHLGATANLHSQELNPRFTNENEVATTLAGLANRQGTNFRESVDRRQPH